MGGAGVAVLKAGPPNTANSEDCNHMGRKEALLGYDLKE